MPLRLTPLAEQDLIGIHEFGALTFGVVQADDYLDGLLRVVRTIETTPLIHRERTEMRPPIRLAVHRAHHVVYRVEADTVLVIRILHHSANWIDLL